MRSHAARSPSSAIPCAPGPPALSRIRATRRPRASGRGVPLQFCETRPILPLHAQSRARLRGRSARGALRSPQFRLNLGSRPRRSASRPTVRRTNADVVKVLAARPRLRLSAPGRAEFLQPLDRCFFSWSRAASVSDCFATLRVSRMRRASSRSRRSAPACSSVCAALGQFHRTLLDRARRSPGD